MLIRCCCTQDINGVLSALEDVGLKLRTDVPFDVPLLPTNSSALGKSVLANQFSFRLCSADCSAAMGSVVRSMFEACVELVQVSMLVRFLFRDAKPAEEAKDEMMERRADNKERMEVKTLSVHFLSVHFLSVHSLSGFVFPCRWIRPLLDSNQSCYRCLVAFKLNLLCVDDRRGRAACTSKIWST